MYKTPNNVDIPKEASDLWADQEALGMICDGESWYITSEWAARFQEHLRLLLPVAENGQPWAQYCLGGLYFSGYIYSSKPDFEAHYEKDIQLASAWLEKAARQGFVAAIDNLVVIGVGVEAERLRAISRELESDSPELIVRWEDDQNIPVIKPSFFETVWEIAYGPRG